MENSDSAVKNDFTDLIIGKGVRGKLYRLDDVAVKAARDIIVKKGSVALNKFLDFSPPDELRAFVFVTEAGGEKAYLLYRYMDTNKARVYHNLLSARGKELWHNFTIVVYHGVAYHFLNPKGGMLFKCIAKRVNPNIAVLTSKV